VDPVTLSALGAVALTEGIKFLYGQAGEILKRYRERRQADEEGRPQPPEPIQVKDPGILAGRLEPAEMDIDAAERMQADLTALAGRLGNFANGLEEVDPRDEDLLQATEALRRTIEAVYHQRITFQGEDRPPSGPLVEGSIDIDEVAGYAGAVRAGWIASGRVIGEVRATRVEREGEAVAVDVKQIGGRAPE
jgi:hypothetical protein